MNDPFASLPDEVILQIALFEPINNINQMCLSSQRFNNLICNNNYFWREKFVKDFGELIKMRILFHGEQHIKIMVKYLHLEIINMDN